MPKSKTKINNIQNQIVKIKINNSLPKRVAHETGFSKRKRKTKRKTNKNVTSSKRVAHETGFVNPVTTTYYPLPIYNQPQYNQPESQFNYTKIDELLATKLQSHFDKIDLLKPVSKNISSLNDDQTSGAYFAKDDGYGNTIEKSRISLSEELKSRFNSPNFGLEPVAKMIAKPVSQASLLDYETNPKLSVICDICGGSYTQSNKSRHYQSKKHQNALLNAS